MTSTITRVHRFTVGEFIAMDEAGILPDDRHYELIRGEIVEMPPIGPGHAGEVDELGQRLTLMFGTSVLIRSQGPIQLDDISLPQPDLVLLRPRGDYYRDSHPTPADIYLVVEVADTTERYDRKVKRPLYAQAGIVEHWLIALRKREVEVSRDPGPEDYRQTRTLRRGDRLDSVALPGWEIAVDELFGGSARRQVDGRG